MTKTPQSERTRLCLRLLAGSANAVVYLAGDGVYNLLGQDEPDCASQAACQASQVGKALWALLPSDRIIACREDLAARGVSAHGKATVSANFYDKLIDDMMKEGNRFYTF